MIANTVVKSLLLVLLLGAFAEAGCGGDSDTSDELPTGVAARIGGKTIRESEVRTQLDATYAAQQGSVRTFGPPDYPACMALKKRAHRPGETDQSIRRQCRVEFDITRAAVVGTLVRAEWLAREARRRGVVTTREVRKALASAERLARLSARADPRPHKPLDRTNVARQARVSAQFDKLAATIPLSEKEIAEYGTANGDVFLSSEVRTAQIVQATTKRRAMDARRDLARHVPWPTVQSRYGIRPFAEHWTGRKQIKKSTAPTDALGRGLFSSKPGKILGPIHTLNGWFVFEVVAIRAPRHQGLSREAHTTVSITLRAKRLTDILERHFSSRTTCAPRYRIPEAPQCQPPVRQ